MWVRVFVLLSRSEKMIGTNAEDRLDRLHHQGCTLQAPVRKGGGSSPTPTMSCLICGLCHRWTQLTSHRSMFERCPKSGHPESNQGPSDRCTSLQSDALPTELCPVNFDHLASDKHKFYTPLIAEPFGRTSGKRPHGEPPNGAKAENRDLKIWKDTKHTQAKSGYFRTGQKSEKHRVAENPGKNGPTASPQMGPKSKIVVLKKTESHQNTGKIGVFSDRAEI